MSEDLIKWLAERKFVAFLLGLVSLVALCGAHKIDASAFSVCFNGLFATFMAATAWTESRKT